MGWGGKEPLAVLGGVECEGGGWFRSPQLTIECRVVPLGGREPGGGGALGDKPRGLGEPQRPSKRLEQRPTEPAGTV